MKIFKKVLGLMLVLSLAVSMLPVGGAVFADGQSNIFLAKDAEWKYLDNGEDLGATWMGADYDDSAWKSGKAPLGFGDDYSETDPSLPLETKVDFGPNPENKYMTTYFRSTAVVENLAAYNAVEVYIHVDDAAVVYINGEEVFRRGIDEGIAVDYSTPGKFKPKEETFQIPASALKEGENQIAVEVHQDGGDSSDLWFEMSLKGVVEDQTVLEKDAEWSYSDDGTDLGNAWSASDFNDAAWKTGIAPLGFGDDYSETDPTLPLATTVDFGPNPENKYMTTYFRKTVNVGSLDGYEALEVYIHVDDGAVVYLNGKEWFRRGIDDGVAVTYETTAKFKPKEETFQMPVSDLKEGENTIAVEVHQDGGDSSDLWFEMSITAVSSLSEKEEEILIPDPNAEKGEVSKVAVTFFGDSTTAKGFTWYTTLASGNSDLQVVEKTGQTADFSKAMTFTGTYAASTHSPSFPTEVVHKAVADGLKANTTYFYRVGDASLNLWSEVGTFETAAETGAFSFIDIADTQAKSEDECILSGETISKAFETVVDAKFMAINGDIVDTGLNEEQWNWMFQYSKETFMNTTLLPVAGNHEEQANSFIEHFNLPVPEGSATETGAYYSVDYSNTHFIVLNTNEDSKEYADLTPAQVEWLKDDAIAAKVAGAEWIVLIMHKGPYTTSNHATDSDIMDDNGVRTLIAPLMSALNIDFVLQGHDHIYARTKPITNGVATEEQLITETLNGQSISYTVKPDGTIYMIPATAGPKVYYKNDEIDPSYYDLFAKADENHAAVYGADPSDSSRPVRSQIQNFVGITVDGNRLTAVVYEIDQSKNNGTPYIVDQFGISKQSVQATTAGTGKMYTVVSGDVLWQIARQFGTTVQTILDLNRNTIKDENKIYAGMSLLMP